MQWQRVLSSAAAAADTPPVSKKRTCEPVWFQSTTPSSSSGRSDVRSPLPSWTRAASTPAVFNPGGLEGPDSSSSYMSSARPSKSARRRAASCNRGCLQPDAEYARAELSVDEDASLASSDEDLESVTNKASGRRLWDTRVVYPAGVAKWDNTANCQAALGYECPCGNMCLSRVGDVLRMYEHRRKFRLRVGKGSSGAMRDTLRESLAEHYDAELGQFSNSFVVSGLGGMCERAFAVAAGVSETTFVRARSDVTMDRPKHAGRVLVRAKRVSDARSQLNAWVRAQRNSMEGDKSTGLKWFTEKVTERQLWLRYVKSCDTAQVPTTGSSRLLFDVWKSHDEIVIVKPTGHAICDTCSEIHAQRLSLIDGEDSVVSAALDEQAEQHLMFHTLEREYYDNAVLAATHSPHLVTCFTIDAPTQHQFDLPSQPRWKRDVAKRLDGTNRWQSKVEAVLDAGVGMLVYVARVALGGGPNLVCTVLYLSLMTHVQLGRPLGHRLHLQLDNTTAENKNRTLIGGVGLLVAWGVFHEAVIFFLPVGHTYNELDAAFSPLITSMLRVAVASLTSLLSFMTEFLAGKRIRECSELHHLWDFDALMDTHMHSLGGFARTQQSSGMHEFHVTLDKDGVPRLRTRQSSQASTWFPEGEGELLFKTLPSRDESPPVAAPVKSAVGWRKAEVQTNVRRWLPNLGLTSAALHAAEREWEQAFALAVDDLNSLPAERRLQWRPLPLAAATIMQRRASLVSGCSRDMIENPPVNPVHGALRKTSQVRTELLEYQQAQRLEAAEAELEPTIYLADYLMLWVNTGGDSQRQLILGRVCGVPAGGAISPTALVDVVAYTHTPQPGVDGFFGTFQPTRNPEYDAKLKGSLMFVRHRDVDRARIVLCNVQVRGSQRQLVRISVDSLRELSRLLPEYQTMPDDVPSSHASDAIQETSQPRDGGSSNQMRRSRLPADAEDRPVVENGARIEVLWTEDPVGWFKGKVTSSRREGNQWVSRVLYDRCDEWAGHAEWHFLDPADDQAVQWRHEVVAANGDCSD